MPTLIVTFAMAVSVVMESVIVTLLDVTEKLNVAVCPLISKEVTVGTCVVNTYSDGNITVMLEPAGTS